MTVNQVPKADCTGCRACKNICPVNCITFEQDTEGFYYPVIDEKECIHCGLCLKTCHKREKAADRKKEVEAYAAYAKDEEILTKSSSGGVFIVLAREILQSGGIVYGAMLDDLKVKHTRIEREQDLHLIQKSKYLQSDTHSTYTQAREDLKKGITVLFSGTPCQISGLYAFLDKEYDNLITCDVVCHGVPSEKVFAKFLDYEEKKHKKKIVKMYWRDKRNGWHKNSIVEVFEDGTEHAEQSYYHSFQRGFLDNLYLRPSCYECKACGIPRVADISLADYWQAEKHSLKFAEENADRGISIVILSGEKGKDVFDRIKGMCHYKTLEIDAIKEVSRHSYLPPLKCEKREEFFADLPKASYKRLMKKYIFANDKKEKLSLRIKIYVKDKLTRMKQKVCNVLKKEM